MRAEGSIQGGPKICSPEKMPRQATVPERPRAASEGWVAGEGAAGKRPQGACLGSGRGADVRTSRRAASVGRRPQAQAKKVEQPKAGDGAFTEPRTGRGVFASLSEDDRIRQSVGGWDPSSTMWRSSVWLSWTCDALSHRMRRRWRDS